MKMENCPVFLQLSSLHKVFPDEAYENLTELNGVSALKGERISYQILYHSPKTRSIRSAVRVETDSRIRVQLRKVGFVPCLMPARKDEKDEYYLRTEPGLFPDALYPMEDSIVDVNLWNRHSLYVTAMIPEDLEAGEYPIAVFFGMPDGEVQKTFTIRVLDAVMPPQTLTYTQWFHSDCIASYYKQEVFSEAHWDMIEKFVRMAVHTGVTQILTPIFTPPLDTEIGRERPTVQLVDVWYLNGQYRFGFEKLQRWIDMCRRCGIKRFEISHLFSQWGSGFTPKIEAETEEGRKKIFGWHVKADTPEYRYFLKCMLPELIRFLQDAGVYDVTCFHVSDEPNYERDYALYKLEKDMLSEFIPDEKLMDALSHHEFCDCGLVKTPVPITCEVEGFLERGYKVDWTYYCCGPCDRGYSNRLIGMPSGRNRIIGVQLYKYDIGGFLHWGYNFYYAALSRRLLNPFCETDADEGLPSGDAYTVYPGENGPIESLRSVVFYEGLQDLRACRLLESYIGREAVVKILEQDGVIRFNAYPRTDAGVAAIRDRINAAIEDCLCKK